MDLNNFANELHRACDLAGLADALIKSEIVTVGDDGAIYAYRGAVRLRWASPESPYARLIDQRSRDLLPWYAESRVSRPYREDEE